MARAAPAAAPGEVWLFRALALLLAVAPLPLGGNRNWALALLASMVALLLPLSWFSLLKAGRSPLQLLSRARLPLLFLAGYAALVAAQRLAGPQGGVIASFDRFATLGYLLRTLACTGTFALVLLLVRSTERARTLALVIIGSGVAQAALAVYFTSAHAQYQVLFEEVTHGARVSGTFVNPDHLAAYLYLCLSLGIGLLVGSLSTRASAHAGWRGWAIGALDFIVSPRMALRVAMVAMVVALVLTRSRMGNAAFFFSLVVLGVTVAITTPALRIKASILVASLVLIDIVIIGQWVGLDRVIQRIDQTAVQMADGGRGEETLESRLDPAWFTLPMIAARPIAGTGGGTYVSAFPPYKTRDMALYVYTFDHAHNDYAEIAADTGLLGLALLAGVVLSALWRIRRCLAGRGEAGEAKGAKGLAYAGLMAITCLLLHSLVDFSLQMPAIAMTVSAMLALIWATPMDERAGRAGRQPKRSLTADWLGLPALLLLGVFMIGHSWRLLLADLRVAEARSMVDLSPESKVTPQLWESIREAHRSALRVTPDNPDLHDQLGRIDQTLARREANRSDAQRALYAQAVQHQRAALALRPYDGMAWATLAESLQGTEPGSATAWDAWRNARRYAPLEFVVPPMLIRSAFMGWDAAPNDVKDWVREAYELELLYSRPDIDALATQYRVSDWSAEVEKLLQNERKWRAAAQAREEAEAASADQPAGAIQARPGSAP